LQLNAARSKPIPARWQDGSVFDCATRFEEDLQMTQRLRRERRVPLVWQSNFPISGHGTITNGFLKKDVECQREQARALGLPMADLVAWGLGTGQNSLKPGTSFEWSGQPAEWRESARSGDWHLTPFGYRVVAAAIIEALERPPPLPEAG